MSSQRERVTENIMAVVGCILVYGFAAAVGTAIAFSYTGEKGIHNAIGAVFAVVGLHMYLGGKFK